MIFTWTPNFTLREGELFEVVLWNPGDDPLKKSYAVMGPTQENQLTVTFSDELDDAVDAAVGEPFLHQGTYMWGVLLVKTDPYERIQVLSSGRSFFYAD